MNSLPKWLSDKRIGLEKKVDDEKHPLKCICGSEERSPFEKDIDAIVHFSAFRRLAHKTQVMLNPHFDFPRTRLIHSIETMRIARQLAALAFKMMNLGDDDRLIKNLTDALSAVCLAHDIGHAPFGHAGERALDDLLKDCCIDEGFDANKQNIRVLCGYYLGEDKPFRRGLNLTAAVIDGLMKKKLNPVFRIDSEILEFINSITGCQNVRNPITYFMDAADDISNMSCDCEDGLKFGLLRRDELIEKLKNSFEGYDIGWKKINDWEKTIKDCQENDDYDKIKSSLIKGLIVHFCKVFKAIVDSNNNLISVDNLPEILNENLIDRTQYPVKNGPTDYKETYSILFHCGQKDEMRTPSQAIYDLKTRIYDDGLLNRKEIKDGENDARTIIYGLWNEMKVVAEDPTAISSKRIVNLLPDHLKNLLKNSPIFQEDRSGKKTKLRYRLIADHISGMTDRYAISCFKRLRGIKTTI
jgi:predicted deoxyguanosinetriphosphate triphosphohydrolase